MERKPGRPRALTVDAIAQAALDDGIDTFSMPSVARRLGVAHSGLYRYVTDRDDLLLQALEKAFLEQAWPSADLPWEELLRSTGQTIWRACDDHPGLARAAQLAPEAAPTVLKHMDAYVESVAGQGFLPEDAAVAVEFAIALALDCSSQMTRLKRMEEAHPNRADIPMVKAYDTDEVWIGQGLYGRKLDIFVAGLSSRRIAPVT